MSNSRKLMDKDWFLRVVENMDNVLAKNEIYIRPPVVLATRETLGLAETNVTGVYLPQNRGFGTIGLVSDAGWYGINNRAIVTGLHEYGHAVVHMMRGNCGAPSALCERLKHNYRSLRVVPGMKESCERYANIREDKMTKAETFEEFLCDLLAWTLMKNVGRKAVVKVGCLKAGCHQKWESRLCDMVNACCDYRVALFAPDDIDKKIMKTCIAKSMNIPRNKFPLG